MGKKENDDEEGENSIKKSKIFLIISLSIILVLIICFILAIVLLPKNPKQIIYKRTGIAFQESAEIIEFDCEKNGTFEAAVRIKNEDRNALENQLIDNSFTKQKRLLWPLKEYLEDDKEDYSYFCGGRSSKVAKHFLSIDFLIVPETESDYCMVYIFYMGGI